jgi:cytochrome o ubiquinol oxidase subunit 3
MSAFVDTNATPALRKPDDPYRLGRGGGGGHGGHPSPTGHGAGGPASKRVVVGYGFWIYLLSDIVMFSAFFTAYAVLNGETAGGPTAKDLFDTSRVAVETTLLLASSFTCGMAGVATSVRNRFWTQVFLLITGLLGLGFILLEVQEFQEMVTSGAGPDRSAFLSSFFAVVGLHGLHVSAGLLWLGTMMAQLLVKGFRPNVLRRLLCFNLFWHALDIVWVALFSVVYLMGVA